MALLALQSNQARYMYAGNNFKQSLRVAFQG